MEFSKRFKVEEVWPAELIAKKPEVPRQDAVRRAVPQRRRSTSSRPPEVEAGYANAEAKAFGFYVQKGLFEEYAQFGRGHGSRPGALRHLSPGARPALAGGQRQGDAVALHARAPIPT